MHRRPLIYRGESLAAFANSVFKEMCRPPTNRKKLSEAQHEHLWQRQGCCCNTFGSHVAAQTNVDHICPRSQGGDDDLDNLQIVCSPCQASKTIFETFSFVEDEHPI